MRQTMTGVAWGAVIGLALGNGAWAQEYAPKYPPYSGGKRVLVCARLDAPLSIDGDLADWPQADTVHMDVEEPHSPLHHGMIDGPEDLGLDIMTAWTRDMFYFAARVQDAVYRPNGIDPDFEGYEVDGLALHFDLDHDEDDTGFFFEGDHAWWVTADTEAGPATWYWREGTAKADETKHHKVGPFPGHQMAVQLVDGGYIMEIGIPMDKRGLASNTDRWVAPFAGRTVGFMVVAVDKDDARNFSLRESFRLAEKEGSFDWGELAWCGSDDRQSGWGNLIFVDSQK
jgi:hypothetical protein